MNSAPHFAKSLRLLQGIFGFRGNPVVNWAEHVAATFDQLPDLNATRRWDESNPALGAWLTEARATERVADIDDLTAVDDALVALQRLPDLIVYRRELLAEMPRAIREAVASPDLGLADAAWQIRNRTRRIGSILP